MADKTIHTIESEDGKHKAEIRRWSHGRFRYQAFKWVPYDDEFQKLLGRKGDWHMVATSGLYETAESCIQDARAALVRLGS